MNTPITASVPSSVVIVGAGLSGLTAARRLIRSGITDVTVLEARGRVGGRIADEETPDGRRLQKGAEFVSSGESALLELARELGITLATEVDAAGALVRYHGGEALREAYPFERDPESGEQLIAATAVLDSLALEVPLAEPWSATRAIEWDALTLGAWLDENVPLPAARKGFDALMEFTGTSENDLSFLYVLWLLRAMGGWDGIAGGTAHRFAGGASAVITRLVEEIGADRILLDAPVRTVRRDDSGVTVVTDRGDFSADAVIVALSPALCGRIQWEPELPPERARLHETYSGGDFIKIFARYDTAWWRDSGLVGYAGGLEPVTMILDVTEAADLDGTLVGMIPATADIVERFSGRLTDEGAIGDFFRAAVREYFGQDSPDPTEVHVYSWLNEEWTSHCVVGLRPGVLTTVGRALREPVGAIYWAGAECGIPEIEGMPAAVNAGNAAADAVIVRVAER